MASLSDEILFERFRVRGDAGALGELFDRTAPALLRIALHLVRDLAAAEDLLQSTFLAVIEARGEWDARRPVMPWLCGILHNRARAERRRELRTPDPGRLLAPSPVDPAAAAAHAEFDAAVDAAIAELPEIYRPVLRLHLAYGHEPTAIAHALERPPGTVRSQLARGLELLRKLLPAGLAGSAGLLLTTGRGLAAVRAAVVEQAAAAGAGVAGVSVLAGGTLLMKQLIGVAVVAFLALAWWLTWSPSPSALSQAGEGPAAGPVAGSVPTPARPPGPALATRSAHEVRAAGAGAAAALRIICRFGEDHSPAAGVLLAIMPWGGSESTFQERTVTTGADGTALVTGLPVGKTEVQGDRGGELAIELTAGRTSETELIIPPGIHVRGRVVDALGLPVPGARVWLSARPRAYSQGRHVATVDADGRFALRSVEAERFLGADAAGLRAAVVQPVRGEIGSTLEVELMLPSAGATLSGTVLDPDGAPVAGACVLVGNRFEDLVWDQRQFADYRPPLDLRTDGRGEFRAHGLEPGSKTTLWVRGAGLCTWHEVMPLRPEGDTQVTVRLQRGATVTGTVTDQAGVPVASALIQCRSNALGEDFVRSHAPDWAHPMAVSRSDGTYRITRATPGTLRLRASVEGREQRGQVEAADRETVIWDPVLRDFTITGRVVDERGTPLPGLSVQGQGPRGKADMLPGARTDAEGRFRWEGLVDVPYRLDVREAGDSVTGRPLASRFGVRPGSDVLVTLADAAFPSAVIEGTVLDKDGRPPAKAKVRLSGTGLYALPEVPVDPATGRFRIGKLLPGTYRLQAALGDWPPRRSAWSATLILSAQETRDVGVVQMPVPGSILATVRTEGNGSGLRVGLVEDHGAGTTCWDCGKVERGEVRVPDLAPGSYQLRFFGPDLPDVYQPVTVVTGQETRIDALVPAGVHCRLQLTPVTEPVPIHETFVWTRNGLPWQRYDSWFEGQAAWTWEMRLLPGAYELTITSETGKQTVNRFVVSSLDPPQREIPIRLP